MKLGDMKCPHHPGDTLRHCVILHEGPPLTVRDIRNDRPSDRSVIGKESHE